MLQARFLEIPMETSSIAHCLSRRRLPSRLWYNVDGLPKAVIYNLAHDGNRTPVADFIFMAPYGHYNMEYEFRDQNLIPSMSQMSTLGKLSMLYHYLA